MDQGIHIAIKAEELFTLGGIPITNAMLMSWLTIAVLLVIGFLAGRKLRKIPGKVQTLFETLFSFLIDYVEEVLGSRTLALRFLPLLATLFLFILFANWLEFIPGVGGSIYLKAQAPAAEAAEQVPADPLFDTAGVDKQAPHETERIELFRPATTDLNVTLALAIISFIVTEVVGVMFIGLFKYLGKFFNFRSVLGFFIGIIELISELVRLLSFSFRLFGNIFAGDVLILVAMFFLPYFLPVPVMLYEVLVGFIQAAIFTLLTLFFIKLAVSEAH